MIRKINKEIMTKITFYIFINFNFYVFCTDNIVKKDDTKNYSKNVNIKTSDIPKDSTNGNLYEIIKKIKEGPYGKICLCKNNKTENKTVVKQISKKTDNKRDKENASSEFYISNELLNNQKASREFNMSNELLNNQKAYMNTTFLNKKREKEEKQEIKINKNIITVENVSETNNHYYIEMEYCKGGDLFDYIAKRNKLDKEEAAYFFYQLIHGVEWLHNRRIVHLDLKPENLFLTENLILKIGDFGFNRKLKENETFTYSQSGTPEYCPLEMLNKGGYDGYKKDIWSCGITLYVMLTGCFPFYGNNTKELFTEIRKCNYILPEYIDEDAKDLIKKILVLDPQKRITIKDIKKHKFYKLGKKIYNKKNIRIRKKLIKRKKSIEKTNKNTE